MRCCATPLLAAVASTALSFPGCKGTPLPPPPPPLLLLLLTSEQPLPHGDPPLLAPVPQVRYDTSEGEMQQVRTLFSAQPHIDGSRVADLLYVVAATAEPRRL